MSIKSILRAVGSFLDSFPTPASLLTRGPLAPPPTQMSLDRLKGRSDWETRWGMRPADPLPIDPAPAVAPWDSCTPLGSPLANARLIDPDFPKPPWEDFERRMAGKSPLWPAHDDPYGKPEPCTVVQDPGLSTIRDYAVHTNENTRRLAERGLSGRPFDSVKSVMDLLQLIERQEMAERELIHRGMEWDPVTRRWIDPDTQP